MREKDTMIRKKIIHNKIPKKDYDDLYNVILLFLFRKNVPSGNFRFLHANWKYIYEVAHKAEIYIFSDPQIACISARNTLELIVDLFYENEDIILPENPSYSLKQKLLYLPFKHAVGNQLFNKALFINSLGNKAAHGNYIFKKDISMISLKNLFDLSSWLSNKYTQINITRKFSEELIPFVFQVDKLTIKTIVSIALQKKINYS
jgi:hypothetical protein